MLPLCRDLRYIKIPDLALGRNCKFKVFGYYHYLDLVQRHPVTGHGQICPDIVVMLREL